MVKPFTVNSKLKSDPTPEAAEHVISVFEFVMLQDWAVYLDTFESGPYVTFNYIHIYLRYLDIIHMVMSN